MFHQFTDLQNAVMSELSYANLTDWQGKSLFDIKDQLGESLWNKVEAANLQDLQIIDYANKNWSNGFGALALKDPNTGQVAISYRGTDGFTPESLKNDWPDNMSSAITGDSIQVQEAIKFYEKNKSETGNNYIYGHSKGGELSAEVFAKYYSEIKKVHVFNPQPINMFKLTAEQLEAFRSGKFDAVVVNGDIVWALGHPPFQVRFAKVVEKEGSDPFWPHMLDAILFDDDGDIAGELAFSFHPTNANKMNLIETILSSLTSLGQVAYIGLNGVLTLIDLTARAPYFIADFISNCLLNFSNISTITKDAFDRIANFFTDVAGILSTWWNKNFNSGYQYASLNPYIKVSTFQLRSFAERIEKVNKRVRVLDKRIDSLYGKVGLLDLMRLMKADTLIGNNRKLERCAKYLCDTAADFENVEKILTNM